ncbi:MAG: hypothetical protein NWE98_06490 [Candidatus Bathyarchaeota archaeon]|nr:hypothetical protein [Candidatus Bathyarchaeota archaeon]
MKISHHLDFMLASILAVATIIFVFLVYNRTIVLSFIVGPFRFSHWLGIIGTVYIAIATPLFVVLKRRFHADWTRIVRFHMFGNMVFFAFIAAHFAAQVGRPPSNYPELGTGLAMFLAMALQVASGFTQRFRSQRAAFKKIFNYKTNMFIHASLVMVFYLVIVFHVLHGLGLT